MSDELELAIEAARAAGDHLLARFESGIAVEIKSSAIDLVTVADREAEAVIIERLRGRFPRDGMLAEESGQVSGGRRTWIIDPLDGTTNFAHGFPHFAVSIALYDGSEGRVGVVYDPIRSEMFVGEADGGAWLLSPRAGRRRLGVSDETDLGRSLLATGFAYDVGTAQKSGVEEFVRLVRRVRGIRRAGSAALDLAHVAAGRFDGFWEYRLKPWDTAAAAVLVREAGGELSRIDGGPWTPWDGSVVAANPDMRAALVESLRL